MQLKDNGQPLREAIATAGLSIAELAKETRKVDPEGRGISKSTIGNLVATGTSSRNGCRPRSCRLIAQALNGKIADFFATLPTS